MRLTNLLVAVFVIIPLSFSNADSATQTDWSGGPGVLGPVIEWGNEFYQSSCINWSDCPSSLMLSQDITEYIIDGNLDGAVSVYSEDIDGDGDKDVLSAASEAGDITWWENDDGSGTSWTEHTINGNFNGARVVFSEDLDGDSNLDVIAGGDYPCIIWWENEDGSGTSWIEHNIETGIDGTWSIYSEDINGDGLMDILCAAYEHHITWWNNMGTPPGIEWCEITIDEDFFGARSIYSEDINGDGDMDVLGAALFDDDIIWWENEDGIGYYWGRHTIDGDFDGARSVYSEDIDGDGDMDVLGAAYYDNSITWWENIDGSGTSWSEHTIDGDFYRACSVYSEDIDGDGDMDVLGASYWDDNITWWENIDGSGTSWARHTVDRNFDGAWSVFSEDINGDGDMDVLSAAYWDDDVAWWDLTETYFPVGILESSIFEIAWASSIFEIAWPAEDSIKWGEISWLGIEPSNTELSFLVRASDDPENMGSWSDTITVSGTNLAGILGGYNNYLQYMVMQETGDSEKTSILDEITITWNIINIEKIVEPIPAGTILLPIIPNPVKGSPVIRFGLHNTASVGIFIHDLSGRLVSEINGYEYSPGYHDVLLEEFSPGIYFCRMISGDFTATQRFVVIE